MELETENSSSLFLYLKAFMTRLTKPQPRARLKGKPFPIVKRESHLSFIDQVGDLSDPIGVKEVEFKHEDGQEELDRPSQLESTDSESIRTSSSSKSIYINSLEADSVLGFLSQLVQWTHPHHGRMLASDVSNMRRSCSSPSSCPRRCVTTVKGPSEDCLLADPDCATFSFSGSSEDLVSVQILAPEVFPPVLNLFLSSPL